MTLSYIEKMAWNGKVLEDMGYEELTEAFEELAVAYEKLQDLYDCLDCRMDMNAKISNLTPTSTPFMDHITAK